jgi:hypothetical protein
MSCETLVVNGIEYVKKDSIKNPDVNLKYVIVRTQAAGVHAGELVSNAGREVILNNARRLWYWNGAASLSQLAMEGVSKPNDCKFPQEVTKIILLDAIEIIPCTEKAITSIKGVKIWKS